MVIKYPRFVQILSRTLHLQLNPIIMKKRLVTGIIILWAAFGIQVQALHAQEDTSTTVITGSVINESNEPIADVLVEASESGDEVLTDEEGNFSIEVASDKRDHITFSKDGFDPLTMQVKNGVFTDEPVLLHEEDFFSINDQQSMPYKSFDSDRVVSAIVTISGEELIAHPSTSFLDALSGRVAGLVIQQTSFTPGDESFYASIRGVGATFYIDGIQRNPEDLTVYEVAKVEVIKDLSGRAALGTNGAGPVIWITTRSGAVNDKEINVSLERGISTPTTTPEFLDAYDYATLYNEALENDGLSPIYSQAALTAYQNGSSPLRYPNINRYNEFVAETAPYTRANLNFTGGDDQVNYFSMLDYVGADGYENIGRQTTYDRYKIRGNVNIRLNDYLDMNVNLSGTYGTSEYANQGGGAGRFNLFNTISSYPANAHAIMFEDKFVISNDHPINLMNEYLYGGYAESAELNTQNKASLIVDLDDVITGMKFVGTAAFDVNNIITTNKGGTESLYRLTRSSTGEDILERVVEREVVPSMWSGYDFYQRSITGIADLKYDRVFDEHAITANIAYYQALQETRAASQNYQPNKVQDVSFRANYAFDERYVVQFDLAYTGNMRLPEGERFNAYPTIGVAWNIDEESFFSDEGWVDHLKLYSSYGVMGVNNFNLPGGYNTYYLDRTLWQDVGGWQTGIEGQKSGGYNIYEILQFGSDDFTLPETKYFNVGVQTQIFDNTVAFAANYFRQENYDQISLKQNFTPSLFGTGGFLPAVNFGEDLRYGVDGSLQYSNNIGAFDFSIGGNAQYVRQKYVVVDEPVALADYRKRANKDMDLLWLYEADGLFQTQEEIDSRDVAQSWGTVQPGDIRYVDFNEDGVVDEKDVHTTGAHAPRVAYGLNFSVEYGGFNLFVSAEGVADGQRLLNSSYFWNSSTDRNYSEVMLDRWPVTNDYPRLTTLSQNNYQGSTFWLENAAYLSIRNLALSYSLPASFADKFNMRELNLFMRGRNLVTFSELNKYDLNPESIGAGINTYPMSRTITFGISTKF